MERTLTCFQKIDDHKEGSIYPFDILGIFFVVDNIAFYYPTLRQSVQITIDTLVTVRKLTSQCFVDRIGLIDQRSQSAS